MKAIVNVACVPVILAGVLGMPGIAQAAPAAPATHVAQAATHPVHPARYIEVWNPPEARTHTPSPLQTHSPHPLQHRVEKVAHVDHLDPVGHTASRTVPVTRSGHTPPHTTAALTASSSRHRAALAWPPAIPRQPGPDGRVLQV